MLEVEMEDCLHRGDASDLVSLLQQERLSVTALSRLDQLVTRDLRAGAVSRVLVVFGCLEILSEKRDDLETLISRGLTPRVLHWFEVVHDLLTSDLQKSSATLLNLTEAFYDYFLLLGRASLPASQLSVVLSQLVRFCLEPELHFPLRLEAIRTINSILEGLSREQRRTIRSEPNHSRTLSQMATAVLSVGDYELQVSLSEALCRLTPRKERLLRANQWFSSRDISKAFCNIRDKDFEVDCRSFLNFVNSLDGDQRRVYTFPCLRAFLDSTELFPPKDDKLEKFWIDFNLGSGCASFFIDDPQGFLWGSVHLLRDEVTHYSLQQKHDASETVLSVQLNTPIMHQGSRGQRVELVFDSEYQAGVEQAAGRVLTLTVRSPTTGGHTSAMERVFKHKSRAYSRGKARGESNLKVLPMSSPSSDEDSGVMKRVEQNTAEILFDQIRHSTPSHDSGLPVGAELDFSLDQTVEYAGSSSPVRRELWGRGRKRAVQDSGYLSDQTEGLSAYKKGAEPLTETKGSDSPGAVVSPEEAGPQQQGEHSPIDTVEERKVSVGEPKSELTSSITAAFSSFKCQLEQHFTDSRRNVEAEVLQSLGDCQQHVSSLLTAVHQHRLLLLRRFETSITDQLNHLQETSSSLTSMNTQILDFFHSEMHRLGSFCDDHLERLKALGSEESSTQNLSSQ